MNSEKVILLAEDSPDDEMAFKHAFRQSGFDNPVIVVRDGDETIAYLQGKGRFADRDNFPLPKALILDLILPKRTGWQVLEWLRSQPEFNDLFVVVLTGSFQPGDLQNAYEMGANSFLRKPCRSQDLVELADAFPEHWAHSLVAA